MPRSDPKRIWDGQQATIDATTRAAQQSVSLEQQIQEIQRQHGYIQQQQQQQYIQRMPAPPTTIAPPPPAMAIPQVANCLLKNAFLD